MTMILTKKQAMDVINEAARYDHEIKALKPHLEEAKAALADWWSEFGKAEGKKFETNEAEVAFCESDVYPAIDISALFHKLKTLGKEHELFGVVKVEMAALKKVLGEKDIRELQGKATATKVSVKLKLKE